MDSEYLKKTVGEPLTEALASLVDCRCHDSVEYVGYYLIHYVERHRTEQKYFDERDTVRKLLDEFNFEQQTIEEAHRKEEELVNKDKEHIDSLWSAVEQSEYITDESYAKIIESIKLVTGANNVYIGKELLPEVRPEIQPDNEEGEETKEAEEKKEDEEEGTESKNDLPSNEDDEVVPIEIPEKDQLPKLIYTCANDGHEFMKNEQLFKDEGITFDLWKPPPPKEDEEEEEQPADEEEGVEKVVKPPPEWKPPVLNVPQVLLNNDIKYFDIPKLGSYLACGCTYTSYLHENAIPIPPPPPKDENAEDEDEAPKKKKKGKGKKGKKKEETPPPSDDEKDVPPPPPLDPIGLDQNMVICLDSLPSDRSFTTDHEEYVSKWCLLLREKLTKEQRDKYYIEFEKVKAIKSKQSQLRKEFDDFMKDSDKENRDEIKGIRKQRKVPEEEKNLRITELNYQSVLKGLQQAFPSVLEYIDINFDPPIFVKDLIQCVFNIIQIPYNNYISDKQPQVNDWNKCKAILSTDFLQLIENNNLSQKRIVNQYETIPSIKALLKTFNEDKIKEYNIGLFALLRWCNMAIELREAHIALRKLEEKERREKEAEEARQKAEEEARLKAEEDERRKEAEEEAKRKAEEDAENEVENDGGENEDDD